MTLTITPLNSTAITISSASESIKARRGAQSIEGFAGSERAVTFEFSRPNSRSIITDLSAFEAHRISNGQPRKNLSGYIDAVCDPGGSICLFEWSERNPVTKALEAKSFYGIFQIASASARGVGDNRVTLIAYPCDRLRYYGQAVTTAQTRPGI